MKFQDLYEKENKEHSAVSSGVQTLPVNQYMGAYKFSKDVAGHDGKKQHSPDASGSKAYTDKPIVVGYTDVEDRMTKAVLPKTKQTVGAGSEEPSTVQKNSPLSKRSVKEAYQNDEANVFYKYDTADGRLKQRMVQNLDEPRARSAGYKETQEQALKAAGIMRSKFDPKKFVQNQNGKWVTVYPYGQQGVAEDSSQKTFTVVYYSKKTDRNVTKTIKANNESEVWDQLKSKGIDVVSVKEQGLNELAPSPGFGGDDDDKYTPADYGKPFKANYLGKNKFEVFCRKPQDPSNVIKLNAEVQKYGLEWEENFGFWFLDSPGAVYLSWKYGEIPLPKAIDQARNPGHIHDLVTDYLTNSPHAAEIQKIAIEYFGFTADGEMSEGMAEDNLKEFAPGNGDGDSGRWYTDDELADIIGDDWFEDFDVSHDEFNIDAYGEKAKQNLASYANSWFDDKGYNVNVMGVEHNEVDHDLKWYIKGSFHNPRFANEGVAEAEKKGLYYNVNKRKKAGTSRDADSPKAPTAQAWKDAAKTAKKEDMSEAKSLAKKVKVVKGEHAGKIGHIREIKHGAFKGAPKTYYIDLDDGGQANNLPATSLRLVKDVEEGITADIRDYFANPGNDTSSPFRKRAMPPEDIQLIMLNMKQRQPVSKADQYRLADWLRRNQRTRTVYADVNEEEVQEAEVRHDRYVRSHGKQASGGHGSWMFTNKEYGEPGKDEVFTAPPGKFGDAAKHAKQWAKEKGHRTVYAMEADVGEGVIYQLDKENPMSGTEVLVIGGAGRYSLDGLRAKARKEVAELAKDLEIEHGGAFRRGAHNVKQLQNTLNTIVAAYDELNQIRKLGGMRSKGIKDEDATVVREGMAVMEKWTQKYKNSINCSDPKGFSQQAHCAGKKK